MYLTFFEIFEITASLEELSEKLCNQYLRSSYTLLAKILSFIFSVKEAEPGSSPGSDPKELCEPGKTLNFSETLFSNLRMGLGQQTLMIISSCYIYLLNGPVLSCDVPYNNATQSENLTAKD